MYGVNHTADAVNTTLLGYPYKPGNRAARLALALAAAFGAQKYFFSPNYFFGGSFFMSFFGTPMNYST